MQKVAAHKRGPTRTEAGRECMSQIHQGKCPNSLSPVRD
ncbi:hypothetical protein CSE45_3368 [Citreicella sp. SE45]|nr:hypothetical protein CSE45_3368 [Citreicella sp. SE45]